MRPRHYLRLLIFTRDDYAAAVAATLLPAVALMRYGHFSAARRASICLRAAQRLCALCAAQRAAQRQDA